VLQLNDSPIQKVEFKNKSYFIKRDDLLSSEFSGNKARKFYSLLRSDLSCYKKIVSHGSNQSNAMYSLSVLAKYKKISFEYYTHHLSSFLKENPIGNLLGALNNGMQLKIGKVPKIEKGSLFIPEGGACKIAQEGIKLLANEIEQWANREGIKKLNIFLPSGTGTTALYLQKYSKYDVYTCSCVGDDNYLKQQFNALKQQHHPKILPKKQKYHFGKLYMHLYYLWQELKDQTGIEFDLLYDPIGWETIQSFDFQEPLLYIHQGGVLGNITMQQRYERKLCR